MAELELIAAIEGVLGSRGNRVLRALGDDAAVVRAEALAVSSIDTIVEGVHFDSATHSMADIGHKALGCALSDIAAMGAGAGEAYVGLALPERLEAAQSLELMAGMEVLAARSETTIAGGDVVLGRSLAVTVAVTGWAADAGDLVYRDGARAGDIVGVTGKLGGSGAGLMLLQGCQAALAEDSRQRLLSRHRRPEPRLAAGRALAQAGVTAMIDVSDGVATDAAQIANRSGVELRIEVQKLPLFPGLVEVARAAGRDPTELAASMGDDYELLVTAPSAAQLRVAEAARAAGSEITWIGVVAAGRGATLIGAEGERLALRGFDHLP